MPLSKELAQFGPFTHVQTKKRFWLFAYEGYYPTGGLNDLKLCFDTLEEVEQEINKISRGSLYDLQLFDNYQILDTHTVQYLHFREGFIYSRRDFLEYLSKILGLEYIEKVATSTFEDEEVS